MRFGLILGTAYSSKKYSIYSISTNQITLFVLISPKTIAAS